MVKIKKEKRTVTFYMILEIDLDKRLLIGKLLSKFVWITCQKGKPMI